MRVRVFRLGAVDRAVGQGGAAARVHPGDGRAHRRQREAAAQRVGEVVGGRQQGVVAPHPVVELHHVQVVAGERVAAGGHARVSGREVGEEAVARRLAPALQHVERARALGHHGARRVEEGGVEPVAAPGGRRRGQGEDGRGRAVGRQGYALLLRQQRAVQCAEREAEPPRERGAVRIGQPHGHPRGLTWPVGRPIGGDVVNGRHGRPPRRVPRRPPRDSAWCRGSGRPRGTRAAGWRPGPSALPRPAAWWGR